MKYAPIMAILFLARLAAAGDPALELAAHYGGVRLAFALDSPHGYLGEGPSLSVMDLSVPRNVANILLPVPGVINDIVLLDTTTPFLRIRFLTLLISSTLLTGLEECAFEV